MLTQDPSARRRGPSLADRTDPASEQALAAYWTAYVDGGRAGRAAHRLAPGRRPGPRSGGAPAARWSTATSVRLPRRPRGPPGAGDPRVVRRARPAARHGRARGPARSGGATSSGAGAPRRCAARSARRSGAGSRSARDRGPRRAARPRRASPTTPSSTTADPSYRVPTPRNDDLLDHDVWLTVDDPDGQPDAAGGDAVRRRVRDPALLPHPRVERGPQRRSLPRHQRAGRRAGRARRALPARHRHAARADQRAAALPADGRVPLRAGPASRVRRRRAPSRRRAPAGRSGCRAPRRRARRRWPG